MSGFHVVRLLVEAAVVSSIFSGIFVFLFSLLFSKLNLVDRPDGKLKKHSSPVPYSGGVAVFLTFFLFAVFHTHFFWSVTLPMLTLFFVLGLLDDIFSLSQIFKFFVQILVLFVFLAALSCGFNVLSAVWMLTVVNAFNLIDVADGLCGVVSLFSAASMTVFGLVVGSLDIALFGSVLAGAILGFLVFNFPPAKCYVGNSGSSFLGACFSLFPFMVGCIGGLSLFESLVLPTIILGVPLSEVFFLILIRSYLRIAPYKGSPHHFYHFLRSKGWSIYKILSFVGLISCNLGFLAISVHCKWMKGILVVPFSILGLFLWTVIVYWPNDLGLRFDK